MTNEYWQEASVMINIHYPGSTIYVIDDHSSAEFLKQTRADLPPMTVINSEFPAGKGELLPYYYFNKHEWDTHAVILHDSMFIKDGHLFQAANLPTTVKFLWHVTTHEWDTMSNEINFLKKLKNDRELASMYWDKSKWYLCFGVASVISHAFLKRLNDKYNFIEALLPHVSTRKHREGLERIFGLICMAEVPELRTECSYMGDINGDRYDWNYKWEHYSTGIPTKHEQAIVKVFTGR